MYSDTQLLIDGVWRPSHDGRTIDVLNPATNERIGSVAHAGIADLDDALTAAEKGFRVWRAISAFERSKIMRRAAELVRTRFEAIATAMTMEQGKPLAEARMEVLSTADILDWFAEEARRTYGRVIPARAEGVSQLSLREPVGPVAAFTPWNFPMSQVVRKVAAALAAGCSIIVKASEETPASAAALAAALVEAGVPAGVLNLVFGTPAEISEHLVPHPTIRKVSFTGSVPVGKHLAALAGRHMKRVTMELGGHAPAIICDDADIEAASTLLSASKFRNAGQVCVSPTRFLVQEKVMDAFVDRFVQHARAIQVGDGLDPATRMGPVVNSRRLDALGSLIADAQQKGASVATGGSRVGNTGNFLEPTVLTGVTRDMRIMNEEPFGPVALMTSFHDLDEAVAEANRLPFGLAAYAFSRASRNVATLSAGIETGMLTINHLGLALPEVPFGGVKDSGYGSEGGLEAMEAYLTTKFVTHAALA
ncbi:NAD-dependent succinate-semialdehyde dehydrogenase [Labrys monachus]|uniref:Succinate-semialdehyde dehydrogenase/glutarate-semialdehyde dehydrogenase n=1 Tax=Labrys monachus TaxID=217067 RepID=A0ABU0FCG9_9HYPH|nr:NAD-dependent succinate-semialdehyde dehydrogenase [Labrys monachus]MDQ0392290.1 succinate-semialdehyde dehydrogenase/glutarate-semialdehyde dehydrogenase [Labrys monachus]